MGTFVVTLLGQAVLFQLTLPLPARWELNWLVVRVRCLRDEYSAATCAMLMTTANRLVI